jgi:hypothetical protein
MTTSGQTTEKARGAKPFGGIVWDDAADLEDSISFVRRFDDPNEAISQVIPRCGRGQRWAIVDLSTFGVVAAGGASSAPRLLTGKPNAGGETQ